MVSGLLIAQLLALGLILWVLRGISWRLDRMARTEQELEADLTSVKTDLDAITIAVTTSAQAQQATIASQKAQIDLLTAQLAAGTPVSQDQLDALTASADALKAEADSLLASVTPPAPAAAPPVA